MLFLPGGCYLWIPYCSLLQKPWVAARKDDGHAKEPLESASASGEQVFHRKIFQAVAPGIFCVFPASISIVNMLMGKSLGFVAPLTSSLFVCVPFCNALVSLCYYKPYRRLIAARANQAYSSLCRFFSIATNTSPRKSENRIKA